MNEKSIYEEGCLSIPKHLLKLKDQKYVRLSISIIKVKKILKCDGLLSTCVQHEINHLDGKLIIDHLSKLKKDLYY